MARKFWYEAWTHPKLGGGGSLKKTCGHRHKTAKLASQCALKQKKLYGGVWRVTSVVYSY